MAENENQNDTEQLEAIKTQLEEAEAARNEANQAKAALERATADKDARITELEGALTEAKAQVQTLSEAKGKELEATTAELAAAREARDQAMTKYLTMAKALNPTIPDGIIGGDTIAEIDQSVDKGKAIVEAVKKAILSEEKDLAAATKVPAGAPTRSGIPTEGMSPKEKIAYAVQPK